MNNVQSISERDIDYLKDKSNNLRSNIDFIIADSENLIKNLNTFKSVFIENTNTLIEEADILRKYNSAQNKNNYNLPGVFADTIGSYDIESAKNDKERMEVIQKQKNETERIKNDCFTEITKLYNRIKSNLNLFATENQDINKFIEELKN